MGFDPQIEPPEEQVAVPPGTEAELQQGEVSAKPAGAEADLGLRIRYGFPRGRGPFRICILFRDIERMAVAQIRFREGYQGPGRLDVLDRENSKYLTYRDGQRILDVASGCSSGRL